MLSTITALFRKAVVPVEIHALFKQLRAQHRQTAEAVVAYITTGNNAHALVNLSSSARQMIDAVVMWRSNQQPLVRMSREPDCLTEQQWMRLGMVFSTCPTAAKMPTAEGIPQWFMCLQYVRQRADNERPVWGLAFLQRLLLANGVAAEQLPRVIITVFIWNQVSQYSWDGPLNYWRKYANHADAQALASFVGSHADIAAVALRGASTPHRVAFAEWLELYPDHIPVHAPIIQEWAVATAKTLRVGAVRLIAQMPQPLRSQVLAAAIDQGTPANLSNVINQAARLGDEGHRVLEAALAQGRGGKRDELLSAALQRSQVVATTPVAEVEIPPAPELDTTPLGDDFLAALTQAVERWRASLEKNADKDTSAWAKKRLAQARSISSSDLRAFRSWLNGQSASPTAHGLIPIPVLAGVKLPLVAAVRASLWTRNTKEVIISWYELEQLVGTDYDLRNLAQAAALAGVTDPIDAVGDLAYGTAITEGHQPAQVWPFFAENPKFIDQALGLVPREASGFRVSDGLPLWVIRILRMFPTLPSKYVPALAQYATGEGGRHRREAQELLETQPHALQIAQRGLEHGKGETRASTAAWMGRIGDPAAIPGLRAALAKEKRELPQAAMLKALSVLGDDVSADLAPSVLATAARKGLAAKTPAGMEWFPLEALPACRWADGTPVEPDTVRWWVVLSVKLKDPNGAGLIPLYVSLLDEDSRARLGTFVLDAWIAQDTLHPSDEVCRDYAAANVDTRYNNYQSWAKRSPEYYAAQGAMTKDQVFDELYREKGREYVGSAINQKGLLALSTGAPGHYVLTASQRFIRDHGQRRAQVEALITAAAGNDDPSAIQFVLNVARRFKQATVQRKAAELVEDIAERRGWSLDELADRTIPSAGFDDNGVLTLDYGPRSFTGRVSRSPKTQAFTIDVFNAEGKAIKALPKPGVQDDAELAGDARKQLTVAKKEIGQVVTLQTARLFEAMCLGRTWDAPTWQTYLLEHPIMRHLVSTLVWVAQEPDDTGSGQLFRPSADGELFNADDDTITLSATARVGLAHAVNVSPAEAKQWRAHLEDYDIKSLFTQFEAATPPLAMDLSQVDDHLGWLSDSFAIRGRATKRGYARGNAEDGGWFSHYSKTMPSAGITITIEFTGSFLPEQQIAAAVERLSFTRSGRKIPLNEVPPVLLAESYADYVFIAEAGDYDPEWESKSVY